MGVGSKTVHLNKYNVKLSKKLQTVLRLCSVVVITFGFDPNNPSSNPGTTFFLAKDKGVFFFEISVSVSICFFLYLDESLRNCATLLRELISLDMVGCARDKLCSRMH